MKFFNTQTQGFTLLETLASIAILSLVIIGPLSVTISSSGYARLTKDTIVATYLAEEAIELLQNQYDSLYVYCRKNASSTDVGGLCYPTALEANTGQTSWRIFKDRLSGISGQPTCYLPKNNSGTGSYPSNAPGNPNGCSFDYQDMQASSTETLVRYNSLSNDCKHMIPISTSTSQYVYTTGNGPSQTSGYALTLATSTSYVCSGVPAHLPSLGIVQPKQYVRSVTIDQIATFETVDANEQYNDDLRVTSSVSFKGLNGVSHTIKVARFMHARP